MARRVVLDCDGCGGPDAETVGPFNLGDGFKQVDLCEDCQEKYGVARLVALASEYGVPTEEAPPVPVAGVDPSGRKYTECPRCEQRLYSGRVPMVDHLQRIHGLSLYDASRELPFEGEGTECPHCDYYGPTRGMAAHLRWHEENAA